MSNLPDLMKFNRFMDTFDLDTDNKFKMAVGGILYENKDLEESV